TRRLLNGIEASGGTIHKSHSKGGFRFTLPTRRLLGFSPRICIRGLSFSLKNLNLESYFFLDTIHH
ncbi:hypothetical protein QUF54_09505, partial [Candidatus Marithioploca araucensis]|nr:hypothetical protein [Candidatus Marithioploca araucensis]